MIRLLILSSVFLLISCATTEKKAKNYYLNNKDQLAQLCSDCFPVKESEIKIDSIFIKGKTITRTDTVQGDCPDGTKVKIPCPKCKENTPDTIIVYKEVKVRDIAHEYVLESKIKESNEQLTLTTDKYTKEKEKSAGRLKWLLILIGLNIGYIGFRFVKSRIKNRLL